MLTLTCDGARHDQLPHAQVGPLRQDFFDEGGFAVQRRSAMAVGWKDTFEAGRRVFLGPCCSGKKPGENRMSDHLTERVAKHLQDNIPNANTVDYHKQAREVIEKVRAHDAAEASGKKP